MADSSFRGAESEKRFVLTDSFSSLLVSGRFLSIHRGAAPTSGLGVFQVIATESEQIFRSVLFVGRFMCSCQLTRSRGTNCESAELLNGRISSVSDSVPFVHCTLRNCSLWNTGRPLTFSGNVLVFWQVFRTQSTPCTTCSHSCSWDSSHSSCTTKVR